MRSPRSGFMIRHIPTGFFYRPSRWIKNLNGDYVKSNLAEKGKIYNMRPSLGWIGHRFYTHLHDKRDNVMRDFKVDEWEIINLSSTGQITQGESKVTLLAGMLRNIAQGEEVSPQKILDLLKRLQV